MIALGLDLSLTSTGWAVVDDDSRDYGRIATGHRGMRRLALLRDEVLTLAGRGPDLIAVEGYSMGSRSSAVTGLAELGGVVRLALTEAGHRWVDVSPSTLKTYATGKGNASKNDVLAAAIRRLGYDGSSSDEADALWLACLARACLGAPVVDLPLTHTRALTKVGDPVQVAVGLLGKT